MTLRSRYSSWKEDNMNTYQWISYRVFHPISDRISNSTSIDKSIKSAGINIPSRQYVSLIFMNALLLWVALAVFSNILAIPGSWISAIAEVFTFFLSITSLPIVLGGVFQQAVNALDSVISTATNLNYSEIASDIETQLRSTGESVIVIGAILLGIATAFDVLIEPALEVVQESIGETSARSTGSSATDDIISPIASLFPPKNQIRLIITVIIGPILAILYILFKLVGPSYTSSERGRKIDSNLARSYTFMHALSQGGLGPYEAMEKLAESEDAYGEVSVAFQGIVRNANKAGGSLPSAIRESAEDTPSDELREFLNGLTNTIETGSDINTYIQSRAERALKEAREKQENRLDMYELLSQGYIIIFVAAPTFFIILQIVQAMVGSLNKDTAQFVPYIIIPVGGFLISAIVYLTGQSGGPDFQKLEPPTTSKWYDIEIHQEVDEYTSSAQKVSGVFSKIKKLILTPVVKMKYDPKLSLFITIPIAILVIIIGIQLGYVPTSGISAEEAENVEGVEGEVSLVERIDSQHLGMSLFTIYFPFLIVAIPWSILYERKRRKREKVLSQLPQMFKSISQANKRGLTLQESIEATAASSDSSLYNELQKTIRTSDITNDINGALIRFANNVRVPRLSQSVRLLVEANRVSSNVTVVVDEIAEDLESKYALARDRKQRVRIFVVIVFVAFMIGSGVLIALDVTFFGFIVDQIGGSGESSGDEPAQASYGQDLPVDFFRRVFLHSLLALAFVSGTVAGMMENGDLANGFKYSIIMSTIAVVAFIVAPIIVG